MLSVAHNDRCAANELSSKLQIHREKPKTEVHIKSTFHQLETPFRIFSENKHEQKSSAGQMLNHGSSWGSRTEIQNELYSKLNLIET